MSETLMTEPAATAPEGSDASQVEAGAPAQASDGQQALETQSQQSQTQERSAESGEDKGQDAEKYGAPESYEFKLDEAKAFDPEVIEMYSELAKELNLSQKSAQQFLDKIGSKIQERAMSRQEQTLKEIRSEWISKAQSDKEFGGENIQENLSIAKKSLDKFGTPELRQLIEETGLGNHPEIIRFMYRAGKAISQDKFVGRSQGGRTSPQSMSDFSTRLYPSQQSQH